MKHWYHTEWNDHEDGGSAITTESSVSPRRIQPAVSRQSPDAWGRRQTTLTSFSTPRRTAPVKDEAQTANTLSTGRPSNSDQWATASDSADANHGCYVVAVHNEGTGDTAAANEQCRCSKGALLVITDDDDVDLDQDIAVRGATSKNSGRTVPGNDSPCPPTPRRSCTDPNDGSNSLLNRKPKMVVKPNCDQATTTPRTLHYCDTTSGRRLAKYMQTGNASLERRDDDLINIDCGTGVPDVSSTLSAATSSLAGPSTLPSRCSRPTPGQSTNAVPSSQRPSDVSDTKTTYAPRLFFTDAGGARAHGSAAVYRVGSCHNGLIGDSENSAINRPSTAASTSYGCGRDPINQRISASGFVPSSDMEIVHESEVSRRRCGYLSSTDSWMCRLFVSTLTSFVAGCLVFFAAQYQLRCSLPVTVGVAVSASFALLVVLLLSRRCRCVVALVVPAASTDRGRIGFVLLTVATLLSGPVVNVEFNVREMARSMICSADIAYNQTLLLLQVMCHVAYTTSARCAQQYAPESKSIFTPNTENWSIFSTPLAF